MEASPTDCNEVKFNVTWNVPQNTGGLSVDVYEVFYKAASSSTFKEKSSTTTSTILDNLSPNTTYTIQVRAKNLIGFGKNMSTDMVMTPSRGEWQSVWFIRLYKQNRTEIPQVLPLSRRSIKYINR